VDHKHYITRRSCLSGGLWLGGLITGFPATAVEQRRTLEQLRAWNIERATPCGRQSSGRTMIEDTVMRRRVMLQPLPASVNDYINPQGQKTPWVSVRNETRNVAKTTETNLTDARLSAARPLTLVSFGHFVLPAYAYCTGSDREHADTCEWWPSTDIKIHRQ